MRRAVRNELDEFPEARPRARSHHMSKKTSAADLIENAGRALFGDRFKTSLAEALKVNRDTVADWCSGRMEPRPGVWADLTALLEKRAPDIAAVTQAIKKHQKSS